MSGTGKLRNRVRELRARLKLRQADLAEAVGVTRQTIIAIEKGRFNPSVFVGIKIARVLREPVDYVFYLAPGAELKPLDVGEGEAFEPTPKPALKRGPKRRAATVGSPGKRAGEESIEVPDFGETVAATSAVKAVIEEPRVEIAAESRPAETALSVAPPEPEYAEPMQEDDSEFDEEPFETGEDSASEPAPAFLSDVDVSENDSAEFQPEEESVVPVEEESAPSAEPAQPKQKETETGQAIWDFV